MNREFNSNLLVVHRIDDENNGNNSIAEARCWSFCNILIINNIVIDIYLFTLFKNFNSVLL